MPVRHRVVPAGGDVDGEVRCRAVVVVRSTGLTEHGAEAQSGYTRNPA